MIVGISGKAGSGKTTVACAVAEAFGGRRASFADELRREVHDIFGVPYEAMAAGRAMKDKLMVPMGFRDITLRELMQVWGTIRRSGDINYWVDKLFAYLYDKCLLTTDNVIVIDDMRYMNEASEIRSLGGLLVRLHSYPEWEAGPGCRHASETELDVCAFDLVYHPEFGGLTPVIKDICEHVEVMRVAS